jgi:NAD(P)-dependent dehydrogenase (short-subunit alcohol dehydrogenase family)
MMLNDVPVVVTGGSRGLGLGLVEALVEQGARVTVVARDTSRLDALRRRLGVSTFAADIIDTAAARTILADVGARVVALNAGAVPPMGPMHELSWEAFTAPWDTDVRGGLAWIQAALQLPLAPDSRVLVGSSGAAQNGSPLSGGYAGAKRMLWIMANYANGISRDKRLGILFQAIVPQQMVSGTGVGDAGSAAYARRLGISPEEFLARFGAPLPPRQFGDHLVRVLTDPRYASATAIALKGDTGITVLEEAAA